MSDGGPACGHCGHLMRRHEFVPGKVNCNAMRRGGRCGCDGYAAVRASGSWGVEAWIARGDGVERRESSTLDLSYTDAVAEAVRLARLGLRSFVVDPSGRRSGPVGKLKT